jgi:hypothetical protein
VLCLKIFNVARLQKREKPLSIEIEGQIGLTPPTMIHANDKEKHPRGARNSSGRGRKGIVRQLWWVVLFISICSLVYSHAANKKDEIIASLDEHLGQLTIEKAGLLQENQDLLLQINSQSDPAWIQLTLMKGLGLVPEGQKKVYFYSEKD